MRSPTRKTCALILVLVFLASACATGGVAKQSPVATYAAVLKTGAALYEEGMGLTRDLYQAGAIDKAFRDKVIAVAWKYWASYHAAQKTLEYYVKFRGTDQYTAMVKAMTTFYADKDELAAMVQALIGKGGT
jgi:hypothetical protein